MIGLILLQIALIALNAIFAGTEIAQSGAVFVMSLIFQPAMVATKREIMSNLPTQHHLGILQGLVVEQPVQLCPLCRGVAVFVLHVWCVV